MIRTLFYLLILVVITVLIRKILQSGQTSGTEKKKPAFRFYQKTTRSDSWVQVYDTDSFDEAKSLQAHLEEEDLECFLYEQGRKDIHGNQLKGYGIAVPKASVAQAQKIISRMPA